MNSWQSMIIQFVINSVFYNYFPHCHYILELTRRKFFVLSLTCYSNMVLKLARKVMRSHGQNMFLSVSKLSWKSELRRVSILCHIRTPFFPSDKRRLLADFKPKRNESCDNLKTQTLQEIGVFLSLSVSFCRTKGKCLEDFSKSMRVHPSVAPKPEPHSFDIGLTQCLQYSPKGGAPTLQNKLT